MSGFARKRSDTVMGSKLLAQVIAFLPSTPTSIVSLRF